MHRCRTCGAQHLTSRLDAVFGALGQAGPGWQLRQDVQPFQSGRGVEDYNYSSDEEAPNEGLKPVMPTRLVDSDDQEGLLPLEIEGEDDETGEGAAREREALRSSLASRRAFEAEAEEDEYDRVATGTMDMRRVGTDARPPGSTEVPLDSIWERMHRQHMLSHTAPAPEPEGAVGQAASSGEAMDTDAAPGTAGTAAAPAGDAVPGDMAVDASGAAAVGGASPGSKKRQRGASGQQQQGQGQGQGGAGDTGQVVDGTSAAPGADGAAAGGEGKEAPRRQRGGRRVQWADFVEAGRPAGAEGEAGAPGEVDTSGRPEQEQGGGGRGGGGGGRGRGGFGGGHGGGRGGRGTGRVRPDWQRRNFVPDHVRNPHRYTVYTLDEELVVGGGDRGGGGGANGRNGHNGRNGSNGGYRSGSWRGAGDAREEEEMRQALSAAQAAAAASHQAEHDPTERATTQTGSGIAFRPRTQRQQQQQQPHNTQAGDAQDLGRGPEGGGEAGQQSQAEVGGRRQQQQQQQPHSGSHVTAAPASSRGVFMEMEDGDGEEGREERGVGALGRRQVGGGGAVRGGGRRHLRARRGDDEEGERDGNAAGGGGDTEAMQQG